jgi:hypothetical protein
MAKKRKSNCYEILLIFYFSFVVFVYFGSGDQIQGLTHARQVPYHCVISLVSVFMRKGLSMYLRLAWNSALAS